MQRSPGTYEFILFTTVTTSICHHPTSIQSRWQQCIIMVFRFIVATIERWMCTTNEHIDKPESCADSIFINIGWGNRHGLQWRHATKTKGKSWDFFFIVRVLQCYAIIFSSCSTFICHKINNLMSYKKDYPCVVWATHNI